MATTTKCTKCNGEGRYLALISQHDDAVETVTCTACGGRGTVNVMSDSDESDYWEDYW